MSCVCKVTKAIGTCHDLGAEFNPCFFSYEPMW